jgi:hypothetical protein
MSLVGAGIKIALGQIAKGIAASAPGTASTAVMAATVVGQIGAAKLVGEKTEIQKYIFLCMGLQE